MSVIVIDAASCARAAFTVAPSPLAGEGMNASPQIVMGEGASSLNALLRRDPLTHHSSLNVLAALSRKGRGHIDSRLTRGLEIARSA